MSTSRGALPSSSTHYRDGIAAVEGGARRARCRKSRCARARRARQELAQAGVPDELARRIANLGRSQPRPTSCWSPTGPASRSADVAATYFAAGAFFRLDRIASAAGKIPIADYFDRLALDRARDSIGDAERRLTAAMVANGATGAGAVEAWVTPRKSEVERIRWRDPRDRQFRSHPIEARRCREFLGDLVKD